MKLFIGNIPGEALLVDIYAFLGGLQLKADFQARQGQTRDSSCYHYVVAELSALPADVTSLSHLLFLLTINPRSRLGWIASPARGVFALYLGLSI